MRDNQKQLNNQKKAEKNRRNFARIFMIFVSIVFLLIVGSFSAVAIFKSAHGVDLKERTNQLYNRNSIIQASRGSILDKNGKPLAEDTNTYSLYAVLNKKQKSIEGKPEYVQDKKKTAKVLSENLPISYKKAYKALNPEKETFQVEFGNAGNRISLSTKEKIESNGLTGLYFTPKQSRLYPNGVFASHIIGLAATMVNDKTKQISLEGQMGIEKSFNKLLTGVNGFKKYQEDNYGYKIPSGNNVDKPAKNGNNVHTTIDSSLQLLLETQLNKVNEEVNPKSMSAIIMDAKTGKILAASQRPTFNPETGEGLGDVWRDALSQDVYEPGSTMKIFTIASAIDSGHYNGNATYHSGIYQIGNQIVPDWNRSGWGDITFNKGFALSSNVAMAHLEQMMGANTWKKYINRFQLLKNNNNVVDGQVAGNIQFERPIEQANTAFGQGIQVTALQMLQGFSAIANNGQMVKPQIIDKVTDSNNKKTIKTYKKEVAGNPIKASTAKQVRKLMEDVVYKDYGIGHPFQIDGYRIAAKTGTAQVSNSSGQYENGDNSYLYSVAGMAPANNPRYIMYVTLKQPNLGGQQGATVLAQVFNPVMKKALMSDGKSNSKVKIPNEVGKATTDSQNDLNKEKINNIVVGKGQKITKQSPQGKAPKDISNRVILVTDGAMTMPNLTGWSKEDVEDFANITQIKVNFNGDGKVTSQSINPEQEFNKNNQLDVSLMK